MVVRIVTDSTADLTPAQAQELGIIIVPLTVFFGDEAYLDNIELDNAAFYRKLQSSKELPRTSQPSPAAFQEAYTRLIQEGADAILSVHLSAKLSGTYQSACTARDTLPPEVKKVSIEVVDSQSISIGMLYPLMKAAEEANKGSGLEQIKAHLQDRLARTRLLAVLDTLEFLKRGGRIGAARALLGNMLSVKPIITLKEGAVVPLEQPRTRNKAFARIAQMVAEMGAIEHIYIAEASVEVGQQLAEALKPVYAGAIPTCKLGGVLGTHTGPGTAAVSVVIAR
ncbi:MAG: DegV family protein [Ktedonobacteraceae bacterium]|nr:DegV family protein [Ktedonobacteraceae bacterium]